MPSRATAVIRVGVVEDDGEMQASLRRLIGAEPGLECVATCESTEVAVPLLLSAKPDVVLVDIDLPGSNGIACVRTLKDRGFLGACLMLTGSDDPVRVFEALKAGAVGYLLKGTPSSELLQGIRDVHEGGAAMTGTLARKVFEAFHGAPPPARAENPDIAMLSPREHQVLEALARGDLVKEIADQLSLSSGTVRTFIRRIYEKLQVRSRSQAAARYFSA